MPVFHVVGTMVMRPRRLTGMSRTTPIGWLHHVPGARRSRVIVRSAGIASPVPKYIRHEASVDAKRRTLATDASGEIVFVDIARVPSSRRMTVVSMCHISFARVVRSPIWVCRMDAQPRAAPAVLPDEAVLGGGRGQTVPSRWARTASVPVGT